MTRQPDISGLGLAIGKPKRGDLVAEEIKRLITERDLKPGDRLPREGELQQLREPLADLKPQFFTLEYGFRR